MLNNIPISFVFILISWISTILWYIFPQIYIFWLNDNFIDNWNYLVYLLQLFISVFLHWDFFHFLFNAIFIYIFWTSLELLIWRKKYIYFFIFIVFFNGILLTFFWRDDTNIIWISWFCMALISYHTLELKSRNNIEYKWGITAIIINILIWFTPWISLLWHLFWVIWGILFYLYNKEFLRPKMVWEVN